MAPHPHNPDPFIGMEILDQYRILHKLGEGGMGAVYEAEQKGLDRHVVIKFLLPELGQNPDMTARFNREARSASRLDHPNIVKIYNFGDAGNGQLYLAMQYVDGVALSDLLAEGPLPPAVAADLAIQIADALAFAHELQVVHRDLKPENILITHINDRLVPHILDFGIAKILDAKSTDGAVTAHGRIFGTPNYMAPEQAESKAVDHRADIYALGVILYEMLTGERPIQASTPMAMLLALLAQEPKPLSAHRELDIPDALERLVMQALRKRPEERPASMLELKNKLQDVLDKERFAFAQAPHPARRWMLAAITLIAIGLATFAVVQQGAERIHQPTLLAASAESVPAWIDNLGPDLNDSDVWRFRTAIPHHTKREELETLLRNDAAEDLLMVIGAQIRLPNFAQAVSLPIVAAKSKALTLLSTAESEGDPDALRRMNQDIQAREARIWNMLPKSLIEALQLEDFFWQKWSPSGTDLQQMPYFSAYATHRVSPEDLDLKSFNTLHRDPTLGISMTHFFPGLAWVHATDDGVVVLEVDRNSPAKKGGMHIGDLIVRIDGKVIHSLADFEKAIAGVQRKFKNRLGVTLIVSRQGNQTPISIRPPHR